MVLIKVVGLVITSVDAFDAWRCVLNCEVSHFEIRLAHI